MRWLALLPVGAGLAFAVPHRFDVFVDREGQGAAIRTAVGRLAILGRVSPFVAEQWLRADGDGRDARDPSLTESTRCDPAGCTAETRTGRPVALVRDISAFTEDCRRAAIIITRLAAPPRCGAGLVLDRKALAERGATALRFREDGTIEIDSVRKGKETLALGVAEDRSEPSRRDRPQQATPVPEQDLPGDDVSSDEPD